MKHRRLQITVFIVSLVIALACAVSVVILSKNLPGNSLTIDDWKSEHAVFRNNGLSVDEELRDCGESADFLWGPYNELKKGSYTAIISYKADEDQICRATSAETEAALISASVGYLSKHLDQVLYQFEAAEDIREFQLVFPYSGNGDYTIRSVSIVPNNNQIKRTACSVLFILLLINGGLALWDLNPGNHRTIAALLGIVFLISLPLASRGIHNGFDLEIHYLRIEAIVQALRSGQFPARISSVTLYGLGYPFSIYYNDIFLYFPAVLRLLGFSVNTAYKLYAAAVNLLTVLIAYVSFSRIFPGKKTGLLLTLLYASASYRLTNVYVRAAVGEYTAQAFLPLAALAIHRMYTGNKKSFREVLTDSILLAAAMGGILGSHILTAMMTCFMLLIFCLICWRKTIRKQTLLSLGMAALFSAAVSLYYLVPFLDYYFNVPTEISRIVDEGHIMIQHAGIYPGELFAFFQNVIAEFGIRPQNNPGLPLMAVLVYGICCLFTGRKEYRTGLFVFLSILTLFLASDIFPWNVLAYRFRFWNLLAQIQMPARFLVFTILFLCLLAGELFRKSSPDKLMAGSAAAAILMTLWFSSNYYSYASYTWIYDTSGVKPVWTGTEYFIQGSNRKALITELQTDGMETAEIRSRKSNSLELFCEADTDTGRHLVTAPVYNYMGYHVFDADGTELPVINAKQNLIAFELPDGYKGRVDIVFKDPASWTAALIISAASVLILAMIFCAGKRPLPGGRDRDTEAAG